MTNALFTPRVFPHFYSPQHSLYHRTVVRFAQESKLIISCLITKCVVFENEPGPALMKTISFQVHVRFI